MSKRVNENVANADSKKKRARRKHRSSVSSDGGSPEKKEVLRRLFGRYCSAEDNRRRVKEEDLREASDSDEYYLDENDDPLLESVPSNMDPEELGFFVCAQETLRFLFCRGVQVNDPTFIRLRSRLLRGMEHIAAA